MRTTLTIEAHLYDELTRRAHREGKPFKAVVNDAIARGLAAMDERPRPSARPVSPAFSMGTPGVPLIKALALADELDDYRRVGSIGDDS